MTDLRPPRASHSLSVAIPLVLVLGAVGVGQIRSPYLLFGVLAPVCSGLALGGAAASILGIREVVGGGRRGPATLGLALGALVAAGSVAMWWASARFYYGP